MIVTEIYPKTALGNQLWFMVVLRILAEKYGYMVISMIVENRHDGENIHNVPEETIEKMRNRFDIKL